MAKKNKKHKKHEEHVDESWLVPYADILTLLLALFIVLFASSTVDQTKLQQMSAVFNEIFTSGTGVMENPTVIQTPNGSTT
ncbi:MAG TPA: flagellar motor protein MotB, partial [Solibacillus sp.]